MKRYLSNSKSILRLALNIFIVLPVISCGFFSSVPWIRNADNNQVVNIGDSIFALSGEIQDFLHSYAGKTFRRYAVSGAELSGGFLAPSLFRQYDTAKGDDPDIVTILMDGGGNDILVPAIALDPYDCKTQWYEWGKLSNSCKDFIDDIYVDAVNLMNDMAADDVDHVIYLGYYYPKETYLNLDSLDEAVDYGDDRLSQACKNSAVDCVFIDPRGKIDDNDILSDAIHPTTSGSLKLADLIWPELQDKL